MSSEQHDLCHNIKYSWEPTPTWQKETSWAAQTAQPQPDQGRGEVEPQGGHLMSVKPQNRDTIHQFGRWMYLQILSDILVTLSHAVQPVIHTTHH